MQGFPYRLEQRTTLPALIEALVDQLEQRLRQRLHHGAGQKPLGLATGRTMDPLYAALVRRLSGWSSEDLELLRRGWMSFNLDEYLGVSASDPCSYRHYMERHLARPLQLPPSRLQLPDGQAEDADAAAQAYGEALMRHRGIGLQVLGLGGNGHVGFNEPPCGPDVPCHVVTLSAETRHQNAALFGGDPTAVPEQAISLGLREILAADEIHLLVTGSGKASILRRLIRSSEPNEHLPASWLRQHDCVSIWADADALSQL